MKDYLVGFSIAVIAAAALFFFYIVPEREKINAKIDLAYQDGYNDCYIMIDSTYVPAEPVIVYRDKIIKVEKPAKVAKISDSVYYTAASIDTSFVSDKDSIGIQATVGMELNLNKILGGKTLVPLAEWFINIKHKDYVQMPDTIIVKVPKLITQIEETTNWLYVLISFITGGLLSIII